LLPACPRSHDAADNLLGADWAIVVLTLSFEGGTLTARTPRPSTAFRFTCNAISDETGGVIAEYRNRSWNVSGTFYTHVACNGESVIEFQSDAPETCGPFQSVNVCGPAIWADGKLIAMLEGGHWRKRDTGTVYPALVITERAGKKLD
jgi:hypothetical protein